MVSSVPVPETEIGKWEKRFSCCRLWLGSSTPTLGPTMVPKESAVILGMDLEGHSTSQT